MSFFDAKPPSSCNAIIALEIARENPLSEDLQTLFERHTEAMHVETPPESIHMLGREELLAQNAIFLVLRRAGTPIAMGALKRLDAEHGEIKSMHVLAESRGQGLSRRLLDELVAQARAAGLTRLSLETGAQDGFAAARSLYAKAGFTECPPFGSYRADPLSVFMTTTLRAD